MPWIGLTARILTQLGRAIVTRLLDVPTPIPALPGSLTTATVSSLADHSTSTIGSDWSTRESLAEALNGTADPLPVLLRRLAQPAARTRIRLAQGSSNATVRPSS